MAIPNTTPTPNELYNGEMRKMTDTELRVVLIVTRATLGWEIDHKTGMRKQEDWISNSQLREKTGRSGRAISTAIESCIKKGWIEARSKSGELLDTKEKRSGNKIYYRLGRIFLDKIKDNKTSEDSSKVVKPVKIVHSTSENSSPQPLKIVHSTKETLTKEIITKDITAKQSFADKKQIDELIDLFKAVNPSYKRFFGNKTERAAIARLLKQYGREKLEKIINTLPQIMGKPYAPTITSPWTLEKKMANLILFLKKEKSGNNLIKI